MLLSTALKTAINWQAECSRLISKPDVEASLRNRTAIALLQLGLEHHCAICALIDHSMHGSAKALYRPLFECCVRGMWFLLTATDEEISCFVLDDQHPPLIENLIVALERTAGSGFEEGHLLAFKKSTWSTLCDFTHGGPQQIKARNSETEIGPRFDEEEIRHLLASASALAYLIGITIARVIPDPELPGVLKAAFENAYSNAT